jgi:outer membrane protein assembly factor BamB
MEIKPLHTKVEKSIQTLYGTVVLESPNEFPRAECNLYCISADGKTIWTAEKPEQSTLYSRMKLDEDGAILSTYTLSGHACDLELGTGKILSKTSIQ